MRILNSTHWRTDQIKALIFRVAQDEFDSGQLKRAQITIKYRRKNARKLGACTYGTSRSPQVFMTLLFPRISPIDLPMYALVIAHELAHAKGVKHRDMYKTNRYWWLSGWQDRYSYASQFPIEAVEEPSREEIELQRRNEEVRHSARMVAKWTTKAKRAGTQLTKWRTRLKAAERRFKQPPQPLPPIPESLSLPASAS